MNYTVCETDLDCPDNLYCYRNVSWAPNEISCICNTFWGFTGEDCTELSASSYFLIAVTTTEIFVLSIVLSIAVTDFWRFRRTHPDFTLISSYVLAAGCLLMVVIFRAFTLISTIVPETTTVYFGAELETFDPTEKKIGVYEVGEVTFLLASSLLEILSISSIALTWILVAESVNTLNIDYTGKILRRIVRFYQVCYVLFCIVVLFTYSIGYSLLLNNLFVLILVVSYVIGLSRYSRLIRSLSDISEFYASVNRGLKRSASIVISLMILRIGFGIVYGYFQLDGWKNRSAEGKVSVHAIIREISFAGAVFAQVEICRYNHVILWKGLLGDSSRRPSSRLGSNVSNTKTQSRSN